MNFNKISFIYFLVPFVVATIIIGLLGQIPITTRWIASLVLIVGLMALMSKRIYDRFDGIFIDSRNKMSLSRLQITMWTILAFSAFFSIALERDRLLQSNDPAITEDFDPLNIEFPDELLLALGISTASLAGASIIKNNKRETNTGRSLEVINGEQEKYSKQLNEARTTVSQAHVSLQELTNQENRLRGELQDLQTSLTSFQQQAQQQQADLTQAQQQLAAQPDHGGLQKKVEDAQTALDGTNAQVQSTNANIQRTNALILATRSKSREAAQQKSDAEVKAEYAQNELTRIEETINNRSGLIHFNPSPAEAKWIELFRGDEVGNYQMIDVSKIQMFFFTVGIIFSYGVLITALLNNVEAMAGNTISLPPFSDSLNTMLGLSHAGYLIVKGTG